MSDDSSLFLIKLFKRLPPQIGFSIDEAFDYQHNLTAIFGINQRMLDALLYDRNFGA
jgi:hypothetical protein